MTFNELIEVTKDMDLASMRISLGKPANCIESLSCYKDGDEWVMLEVDDRQNAHEKRGKEEDIIRAVYVRIKSLAWVAHTGVNRKEKSDQLPDTLSEFMDSPHDLPTAVFLKKYGAEKIFWIIGRDKKTGNWILHWCPDFKGTGSEGVYFTYEDACAALVMRSVTCPLGQRVIRCGTVKQLFTSISWNIRFIRSDGKVLAIWQNGDTLSTTVYTQDELMAQFVSKYGGKTVIAEDFFRHMAEFNLEDFVVWVLAAPDIQGNIGMWNLRRNYKYDRAGLYSGEKCYHVFS